MTQIIPDWQTVGEKVAAALVTVNPVYLGSWLDALRPVQDRLTRPLATIFRDKARPETEHILATSILADYASDDPDLLAELLMIADPKAYARPFPVAAASGGEDLARVPGRARQDVDDPGSMSRPRTGWPSDRRGPPSLWSAWVMPTSFGRSCSTVPTLDFAASSSTG